MLTVSNLSYRYRKPFSRTFVEALKGISFDIRRGEAFGFLGHNGAGKTTAIKCILSLVTPSSGSILVDGVDSREPFARANIGYVPEHPYFYDHLTVFEAVKMYGLLSGVAPHRIDDAVGEVLHRLHIEERSASRLRTLSKGLNQRVALAQAIINHPKLLILDEPFSGLDPIGRKQFRELFLELKQEGTTIMMSSHVLSDVERICDRVSILFRGELKGIFDLRDLPRLDSESYELVVDTSHRFLSEVAEGAVESRVEAGGIRLLFDNSGAAHRALAKSLRLNARIKSFATNQGTLEELFAHCVQGSEVSE